MSRNTGGTYALPTGNPVVSGTTITSTWANSTFGDISSEITDSLCRSGKGAMLAPLQLADGTAAAPALTFDTDPDSGIYSAGAGDVRMQIDATQAQKWTATGSTLPVPITVTTAVANTAGVTATGNGTGAGVSATGGATSGNGMVAVGGAPNGDALYATGTGTGAGLVGQGGTASGTGLEAQGGAPNGAGIVSVGAGTGAGGSFTPGTAASASARTSAIVAGSGDIVFTGVTNPNSNVAFTNTLAAMNTPKAWATLTTAGGGNTAVTVTAGFNIASALCDTTTIGITFASAFTNTNYTAVASCRTKNMLFACNPGTTTGMGLTGVDLSPGTDLSVDPIAGFNFRDDVSVVVHLVVFGAQ